MTKPIRFSTPVQIIVGSMLGAAEYVAEAMQEELNQHGINSDIHLQPDFGQINISGSWIICSSTHGAGDLPDNIQEFGKALDQLSGSNQLRTVTFLTVALGDTSYDTFCQAGKTLHQAMLNAGGQAMSDVFSIDVLEHPIPEDAAVEWLEQLLQEQNSAEG